MQAKKNSTKKTVSAATRVHKVRTTVGDLIASLVEVSGAKGATDLLRAQSPLQKVLRQRLVLV